MQTTLHTPDWEWKTGMLTASTTACLWKGIHVLAREKYKKCNSSSHPEKVAFDAADVLGGIKDIGDTEQQKRMDRVNNFRKTIYTRLQAFNMLSGKRSLHNW